jgi:hypothetical protein
VPFCLPPNFIPIFLILLNKILTMKKILLLTTLFLAFACSKDDEDGDDNSSEPKTFLEKYDGTSWRGDESGESYILTLIDGTYFYNYVDLYNEDVPECYKIKRGAQIADGDQIEVTVLKNEPNEMILEIKYDGALGSRVSLTINGETLTERQTYFEDGSSSDEAYTTYTKTSASYSDYCN